MQSIDQLSKVFRSLEFKLSKYERVIQSLTSRISMHRQKKLCIMDDGQIYALHRKKIYEWRRISFALHRKRSELKAVKNSLAGCMEKGQTNSVS